MYTTQIERNKLIDIVQDNAKKHAEDFATAWSGYIVEMRERTEQLRVNTSAFVQHVETVLCEQDPNKPIEMQPLVEKLLACRITVPAAPVSHTKDYQRLLAKLKLDVREIIELDDEQFNQYVLDEWTWKEQFVASTAMYNSKATPR